MSWSGRARAGVTEIEDDSGDVRVVWEDRGDDACDGEVAWHGEALVGVVVDTVFTDGPPGVRVMRCSTYDGKDSPLNGAGEVAVLACILPGLLGEAQAH